MSPNYFIMWADDDGGYIDLTPRASPEAAMQAADGESEGQRYECKATILRCADNLLTEVASRRYYTWSTSFAANVDETWEMVSEVTP